MSAMSTNEDDLKYMIMEQLQANMRQLEQARSFLCVVGGVCAGVLNATNLAGLVVFMAIYLSVMAAVSLKVGLDFKNYANTTFLGFMFSDLSKHGLSFVLFWTLTYAVVYIY